MDQIKCFQRKAEVNHEIQLLKAKMRDSQVSFMFREPSMIEEPAILFPKYYWELNIFGSICNCFV